MLVLCSTNPPPGEVIKRLRRQYEGQRLDHVKRLHDVIKKVAKEEVDYLKSLLPEKKPEEKNEEEV